MNSLHFKFDDDAVTATTGYFNGLVTGAAAALMKANVTTATALDFNLWSHVLPGDPLTNAVAVPTPRDAISLSDILTEFQPSDVTRWAKLYPTAGPVIGAHRSKSEETRHFHFHSRSEEKPHNLYFPLSSVALDSFFMEPTGDSFASCSYFESDATSNGLMQSIISAWETPRLSDYEQYAFPNWDGYGAAPISRETLTLARKFLAALPQTFGEPDVAPGADGSIALEWHPDMERVRKMFLDIGPGDGWRAYWLSRSGDYARHEGSVKSANLKAELKALFESLSD